MFTLNDIMQGNADRFRIQSSLPLEPQLLFHSAHHDSRQVEAGDLFVALKGARVDGHSFLPAVARAGALGALCTQPSNDLPVRFVQVIVPSVVEALQATARVRAQRQKDTIFIGITGSNGKTSTKDAVAAVLSRKAATLKTQASYNNEIGYPLTLLRLEPQHRYAVLEMGAQWVGELAGLCRTIMCPNWAIITNVGAAHLEFFGSPERVLLAKTELVQALTPEGIAILNYDDVNVRAMSAKTSARVLYYGCSEGAEVRAQDIGGDILFGHSFTLTYHGRRQHVRLRLPGEHGVTIALAAAAAGCAAELPLDEIGATLEKLLPTKGRGEIKSGPRGSILIDDSYNANRQSILAIARAMRETGGMINQAGRRWAVLGDIFELGPYAQTEHYATGEALAETVDYLLAIGEQARYYVEGATTAGMPQQHAYYFSADPENETQLEAAKRAAADLLMHEVHSSDLILLKGSRGMRMETMLDMLA
ncbi:MAG: UDP-N-acetylmuramoyl-tripeptide--D-alanyl-D-alanine ligase [Ktedonobacteraceae bacterium]|nr:UDP-N-acetylmuramoyl-tripeptide--D-alanyl-D-alanine ligase [Ktedonobacteraceae bacterium]